MLEQGHPKDPIQSDNEFEDLEVSECPSASREPMSFCSCGKVQSPYFTTKEVAEYFRKSSKTIYRWMKKTKQLGIEIPWVGENPPFLWKKHLIKRWGEELHQWPVSEKKAKRLMKLDGGTVTKNKGPKRALTKKQQGNSASKSKDTRRSGKTGNLRAFAKSLT